MIVLDTHVWIWWVSKSTPLSTKARRLIEKGIAESALHVSAISVWEIAHLVKRGRLQLTMDPQDWIAQSEALPFLHGVPIDTRIALKSVQLPDSLHADPADRIIVATALTLGATLITTDEKLLRFREVTAVW